MFTSKSLLIANRPHKLHVLKNLSLFFLGASATLLMAHGLDIQTSISTATTSMLQKLFVMGADNTTTGVILDGASSKISATTICDLAGTHCVATSEISTGASTVINATTSGFTGDITGLVDNKITTFSGWLIGTYLPNTMASSNTFSASNYYLKSELYTTGEVNSKIEVLSGRIASLENAPSTDAVWTPNARNSIVWSSTKLAGSGQNHVSVGFQQNGANLEMKISKGYYINGNPVVAQNPGTIEKCSCDITTSSDCSVGNTLIYNNKYDLGSCYEQLATNVFNMYPVSSNVEGTGSNSVMSFDGLGNVKLNDSLEFSNPEGAGEISGDVCTIQGKIIYHKYRNSNMSSYGYGALYLCERTDLGSSSSIFWKKITN